MGWGAFIRVLSFVSARWCVDGARACNSLGDHPSPAYACLHTGATYQEADEQKQDGIGDVCRRLRRGLRASHRPVTWHRTQDEESGGRRTCSAISALSSCISLSGTVAAAGGSAIGQVTRASKHYERASGRALQSRKFRKEATFRAGCRPRVNATDKPRPQHQEEGRHQRRLFCLSPPCLSVNYVLNSLV